MKWWEEQVESFRLEENTPFFITVCGLHSDITKFCEDNFPITDFYVEFPAPAGRRVYFRNEADLNYFKITYMDDEDHES